MLRCPYCGAVNKSSAEICFHCSRELSQAVPQIAAAHPDPDPDPDPNVLGDRSEYYKAAIGSNNQDYYLRYFFRFDHNGKAGTSWHWPAFFVTFYWLMYRKMWLNALIYFFLSILVMIIQVIFSELVDSTGQAIYGIVNLASGAALLMLPPLYANALYYRHCRKKIADVRLSSPDLQKQLGELAGNGGASIASAILFGLLIVAGGVVADIAIPTYQKYVARAHLEEAAAVGTRAAEAVGKYYSLHHKIPNSLEEAGFVASLPPSVSNIAVNNQNGVVSITMAVDQDAGKSLLLLPLLNANKQIIWKCVSREISRDFLPYLCRQ